MKTLSHFSRNAIVLLVASGLLQTGAANARTCRDLLSQEPQRVAFFQPAYLSFFVARFETEFDMVMEPAFKRAFGRVLFETLPLTDAERQELTEFFGDGHLIDPVQKKLAQTALGRTLSRSHLAALRAARIFDRDFGVFEDTPMELSRRHFLEQKARFLKLFSFTDADIVRLEAAGALTDGIIEDARYSYYMSPGKPDALVTPSMYAAYNAKIVATAQAYKNPKKGKTSKKTEVSKAEADRIYSLIAENAVTRFEMSPKYDPDGRFGFCFGRAMLGHILALKNGIDPLAIRKVWVTGAMHGPGSGWQFHVAFMLANEDGGFWVLDTVHGGALNLDEWHRRHQANSIDGRLRLFISDPKRFGATGLGPYHFPSIIGSYNQYFEDLIQNLKQNGFDVEKNRTEFQRAVHTAP